MKNMKFFFKEMCDAVPREKKEKINSNPINFFIEEAQLRAEEEAAGLIAKEEVQERADAEAARLREEEEAARKKAQAPTSASAAAAPVLTPVLTPVIGPKTLDGKTNPAKKKIQKQFNLNLPPKVGDNSEEPSTARTVSDDDEYKPTQNPPATVKEKNPSILTSLKRWLPFGGGNHKTKKHKKISKKKTSIKKNNHNKSKSKRSKKNLKMKLIKRKLKTYKGRRNKTHRK
jgi:hypothetical protein